jgi:hypothetical protein
MLPPNLLSILTAIVTVRSLKLYMTLDVIISWFPSVPLGKLLSNTFPGQNTGPISHCHLS